MVSRVLNGLAALRSLAILGCVCALAACVAPGADGTAISEKPAAPAPDYATTSDHFAGLQKAGLTGDYAAFAKHLKAQDAKTVTDALQRSFRGGPFDVYTRKSSEASERFQRLVELRSTSGRLYLYVSMDRVPGGWTVSGHALDRKRDVIMARL